jgi:ATP-dependent DNA ligase
MAPPRGKGAPHHDADYRVLHICALLRLAMDAAIYWPVLRPVFIPPCEPTLRDRLPKGEGWFYEVKHDGYRLQVHKAGHNVTLYTRNGTDWTERLMSAVPLTADASGPATDTVQQCARHFTVEAWPGGSCWAFRG